MAIPDASGSATIRRRKQQRAISGSLAFQIDKRGLPSALQGGRVGKVSPSCCSTQRREQQKQRRAQRGPPWRKQRQQEQRQAQQRALVPQLEPAEQSLATAAELEEQPYVGHGDARAGREIPPPC